MNMSLDSKNYETASSSSLSDITVEGTVHAREDPGSDIKAGRESSIHIQKR
jgi:hypothetical protein